MMVRGIRGATTVEADTIEEILEATTEVLAEMIRLNGVKEEDVASILFTTTPDLTACFPAKAMRDYGWQRVPMLGFQEMDVPNGLKLCIRVLLHWNTDMAYNDIEHIYLRGAVALRPDLVTSKK
jgi:chorismate mutase